MRGKKGGAMLTVKRRFGAVEPVMFAYVYRFCFPEICACVAIGPEIGVHRVLAQVLTR